MFTEDKKLICSPEGKFRVLMMSDIQECADYNEKSLRSVSALLDAAKPDLVILGGDNCDGQKVHNYNELKAFLDIFTAPMIKRGIPWAHVYGNHDHDAKVDISLQQELYESYPFCVSGHTDDSVHGKSNFVLPIYDHKGENVIFNVWGLDTNNTIDGLDGLVPSGNMNDEARLDNNICQIGDWEGLWFDQLMWYWNTSCAIEKKHGRKIPGLMCMHVAPVEYKMAYKNAEQCVLNGHYDEELSQGLFNSGLFAEILQRGDVRTISCGHTHHNDFEAIYCGIRLCWDACVGYDCYGIDDRRGGRIFDITEQNPWSLQTQMLRTLPLLEEAVIL